MRKKKQDKEQIKLKLTHIHWCPYCKTILEHGKDYSMKTWGDPMSDAVCNFCGGVF